jgi:hypothetical protein
LETGFLQRELIPELVSKRFKVPIGSFIGVHFDPEWSTTEGSRDVACTRPTASEERDAQRRRKIPLRKPSTLIDRASNCLFQGFRQSLCTQTGNPGQGSDVRRKTMQKQSTTAFEEEKRSD